MDFYANEYVPTKDQHATGAKSTLNSCAKSFELSRRLRHGPPEAGGYNLDMLDHVADALVAKRSLRPAPRRPQPPRPKEAYCFEGRAKKTARYIGKPKADSTRKASVRRRTTTPCMLGLRRGPDISFETRWKMTRGSRKMKKRVTTAKADDVFIEGVAPPDSFGMFPKSQSLMRSPSPNIDRLIPIRTPIT